MPRLVLASWAVIALIASMHFCLAWKFASHDAEKTPHWRVHRLYDDTQNSVRSASIDKYGRKNNPALPVGFGQGYLWFATWMRPLFTSDTGDFGYTLTLRRGAALAFAACYLVFFSITTRLFSPWIAIIVWICFWATTGHFAGNAFVGKENAATLLTVLLACRLALVRKRWAFHAAAVLLGIGAAMKLYPLLALPMLWYAMYLSQGRKALKDVVISGAVATLLFVFLSPSALTFSQGAGTVTGDRMAAAGGVSDELRQIWVAFWRVVVRGHAHLWLALAALCLVRRSIPLRHWKPVGAFLVFYYGLSLWRQNYYPFVVYFLVGEVILLLTFGWVLEEMRRIENPRLRWILLSVCLLLTMRLSWNAGHFNHANTFARMTEYVHEARHSTFDDLDALSLTRQHKVMSDWYIPHREPGVLYALPGVERRAAGFLDEIHENYRLQPLSQTWIRDELATRVTSYEELNKTIPCLDVERVFEPGRQEEWKWYLAGAAGLFRSFSVSDDRKAGPKIFVFDAKRCTEIR